MLLGKKVLSFEGIKEAVSEGHLLNQGQQEHCLYASDRRGRSAAVGVLLLLQ